MKRIWLVSFFTLWFANLFFVGMMIGQFYQGQILDGSPQEITTFGKTQIFTIRITDASKQVLSRLDERWRTIIHSKRPFGIELVADELTNRKQPSSLEVNLPIQVDLIEELFQQHIGGRPDPFLDLASLKAIIKPNPIIKDKPVNKDKDLITTETAKKPGSTTASKELLVKKPNPVVNLCLRGIVAGETYSAYIESQNGYQRVMIGDSIAGGKVTDITKQSVTIQMDDQSIELTAEGSK